MQAKPDIDMKKKETVSVCLSACIKISSKWTDIKLKPEMMKSLEINIEKKTQV